MTGPKLSRLGVYAACIAGYVFLDWASYIHPLHGLGITAWNPAPALGLAMILRYGPQGAVPLFIAILLAEVTVRGLPTFLLAAIGLSVLLTTAYTAMGLILKRHVAEGRLFGNRRELLIWCGIVIAGTLLTSLAFVSVVAVIGLIPTSEWSDALVRFWIGDGVGILVSMPLLCMLMYSDGRAQLRDAVLRWETLGYVALTLAALWIAFGLGAEADFKYLYALSLPIVWTASRQGLVGAIIGAAFVQVGIIVAVRLLEFQAVTVIEIQMLALFVALVGFFIGIVVDEHRRMGVELRHSLRLAAAGEMAGALAHELNQPLTAVSAYGNACRQLLEHGDSGERLRDAIERMVSEGLRAAEVVRRLRDFFRTGATRLEPLTVVELMTSAAGPFHEKAQRDNVLFAIPEPPVAVLLADRLQLEVLLRNLLSNAFDAVNSQQSGKRWVLMKAESASGNRICISVEDSGGGVTGPNSERIFEAFQTNKSSGLGLGLSISRAIVEAHGGSLWAETADHGVFRLILPLEDSAR